eukprot:scaffold2097_cov147-Pinguiococcus_pyrenoidosus.AAC.3
MSSPSTAIDVEKEGANGVNGEESLMIKKVSDTRWWSTFELLAAAFRARGAVVDIVTTLHANFRPI